MVCKHEVRVALGLWPYIMALVESKAYLQGIEEVVHKSFHPHGNDKDFLLRACLRLRLRQLRDVNLQLEVVLGVTGGV